MTIRELFSFDFSTPIQKLISPIWDVNALYLIPFFFFICFIMIYYDSSKEDIEDVEHFY